jgi:chromosome segregation ATPase
MNSFEHLNQAKQELTRLRDTSVKLKLVRNNREIAESERQQSLDDLRAQVRAKRVHERELDAEVHKLKTQIASLWQINETDIQPETIEKLEDDFSRVKAELKTKTQERDRWEAIKTRGDEFANARHRISDLAEALNDANEKKERLERENDYLKTRIQGLKEEIGEAKNLAQQEAETNQEALSRYRKYQAARVDEMTHNLTKTIYEQLKNQREGLQHWQSRLVDKADRIISKVRDETAIADTVICEELMPQKETLTASLTELEQQHRELRKQIGAVHKQLEEIERPEDICEQAREEGFRDFKSDPRREEDFEVLQARETLLCYYLSEVEQELEDSKSRRKAGSPTES